MAALRKVSNVNQMLQMLPDVNRVLNLWGGGGGRPELAEKIERIPKLSFALAGALMAGR